MGSPLVADNCDLITLDILKTALDELQWQTYDEVKKRKAESLSRGAEAAIQNEFNFNDSDLEGRSDERVSRINSTALVEIANQLKRIADFLEKKG